MHDTRTPAILADALEAARPYSRHADSLWHTGVGNASRDALRYAFRQAYRSGPLPARVVQKLRAAMDRLGLDALDELADKGMLISGTRVRGVIDADAFDDYIHPDAVHPWAWTMRVGAADFYFKTKVAALAGARAVSRTGKTVEVVETERGLTGGYFAVVKDGVVSRE